MIHACIIIKFCEAVKELLKPDADTVKVSRKLEEIKCLK